MIKCNINNVITKEAKRRLCTLVCLENVHVFVCSVFSYILLYIIDLIII